LACTAVIIPYYQRDAGILRECLQSVVAQKLNSSERVHLIIVDDASPSAPEDEISELELPPSFDIEIIKRTNGGPGAARNTGLDHVPDGAQFVAFIDSDDRWQESHLATALQTLDQGYDLYFCDHQNLNQNVSHFQFIRDAVGPSTLGRLCIPDDFVRERGRLLVRRIDENHGFAFTGQEGLNTMIKYFFAHISTVVYRYKPLAKIRFNPHLRVAAEDYLFVLELASRTDLICFSGETNMHRGRGINMYMNAVSWDSENNVSIIFDDLLCFLIASRFQFISARAHQLIKRRVDLGRALFVYLWCRRLVKFKRVETATLLKAARTDPGMIPHFPRTIYKILEILCTGDKFMNPRRLAKL
jgi:succinoglycan biosynthesis protein ExoW